jgi:hypothetical protein
VSILYTFAFVAEKYWGEEITVRAKKTNLNRYDYIYFSIEALSTIGMGMLQQITRGLEFRV